MKNKGGLEKPGIFQLKLAILDVWDMPNGFMIIWIAPWSLWPSNKKRKCQNYAEI